MDLTEQEYKEAMHTLKTAWWRAWVQTECQKDNDYNWDRAQPSCKVSFAKGLEKLPEMIDLVEYIPESTKEMRTSAITEYNKRRGN